MGTELVMDPLGGPIHVLDLSNAPPILFHRDHGPPELDAFVYEVPPARLGLDIGELGQPAGLLLSAPTSAHRYSAGHWRPHPSPESSPLWGRRSRHDVVSCSAAGGCSFALEDRCDVPCREPLRRHACPRRRPRPPGRATRARPAGSPSRAARR